MTTWAIIPVKHLRESKRRLDHLLSAEERAGLIRHFLDNLLVVLNAAPGIDRVLVITADSAVAALATRHGAEVLVEAAPSGLTAAVAQGATHAAAAGARDPHVCRGVDGIKSARRFASYLIGKIKSPLFLRQERPSRRAHYCH